MSILDRLKKYTGLNKNTNHCPPNPCITVCEAISIADEIESLRQKLAIFESAVEHVTENGKTKRSFSVSEGWAMVHKERLIDLECAEEQLTKKDAEIERLNSSPTIEACRQMIKDKAVIEASVLHGQLVASQAREQQLRAALRRVAWEAASYSEAVEITKSAICETGILPPKPSIAIVKGGAA